LAASLAQAAPIAYIALDNLQNANNAGEAPLTGPTATTHGYYWLDTGSGPNLLVQDVNLEFLGGTTPGSLVDLVTYGSSGRPINTPALFLLSNPVGTPQSAIGWSIVASYGHIPGYCYEGILSDPIGTNFGIPGVVPDGIYPTEIRAWTGSYSTYAAALAAATAHVPGAYVGKVDFNTHYANSLAFPNGMEAMPALVLSQPVPEPSTLLLMAAGLLGLLAYAWRKRK
jgi:hypothetical protein